MNLPASLQPFLPPTFDPSRVSDCALFRTDAQETLLVRMPEGIRLLTRTRPDAKYEVIEVRDLRADTDLLRVTSANGERVVPLATWLDRELVRDFVRTPPVPVGRAVPPTAPSAPATPRAAAYVAEPALPAPTPTIPSPAPSSSTGPMRLSLRLSGGRSQNPILAIKAVRELSGVGLKEAKDLVEQGGLTTIIGGTNLAQLINDLDRAGCPYEINPL